MKRQRLKIMLHTHQRMKRNIFYLMRKRITGNGLATAVHCAWVFYMIGTSHELSLSRLRELAFLVCMLKMNVKENKMINYSAFINNREINYIFWHFSLAFGFGVCVCVYICVAFHLLSSRLRDSNQHSTYTNKMKRFRFQIPIHMHGCNAIRYWSFQHTKTNEFCVILPSLWVSLLTESF